MERSIYNEPRLGQLDQGVLFYHGTAYNYQFPVFGLVITPRCDIAHQKTSEIHYLPAVNLRDWIRHDGKFLMLESSMTEVNNKIKNEFDRLHITHSLLERNNSTELLELMPRIHSAPNKIQKTIELLHKRILYENIKNGSASNAELKSFFQAEEKHLKGLLKELRDNRRKEYYLLDPPNAKYQQSDDYLIVLNREIKKISSSYATRMANGLELHTVPEEARSTNDFYYDEEEIIFPLKVLTSPYIEHLIQVFLSNFNRVGVTDHTEDLHTDILKNIDYDQLFVC